MWSDDGEDLKETLYGVRSEVKGRQPTTERNTVSRLPMKDARMQVEAPEFDCRNEAEVENEYASECFLFVEVPDAPHDETSIQMEPNSDDCIIEQDCLAEDVVWLPNEDAFTGIGEDVNVGKVSANRDGGRGNKETNSISVYEFDNDMLETAQIENYVPKMRLTSRTGVGHQYDKKILYFCAHCLQKFYDKTALRKHVKLHLKKMHAQKKLHTCIICSSTFSDQKQLNLHSKQHKVASYFCNLCPEKFCIKRDMTDHLKSHTHHFVCPHCPAKFIRESNLCSHVKIRHEKLITASTISRRSIDSVLFAQVIKSNFKNLMGLYTCDGCSSRFKTHAELRDHLKAHTNSFQCWQCPAILTQRYNLHKHMKMHAKKLTLKATVRKRVSKSFIQTMEKPKTFPCHRCSKEFEEASLLAEHVSSHFDSLKFQYRCKLCSMEFHENTSLTQHVLLEHHDSEDLTCKLCNATFAPFSTLKTHLKICMREKLFTCFRCPAIFYDKQDVQEHFRVIHLKMVYTCGNCYAGFCNKKQLREHLETHDNTFPCPICAMVFNLEPNLKEHLKGYLKEESSSVGNYSSSVLKNV